MTFPEYGMGRKSKVFDYGKLKRSFPKKCDADAQREINMAAETGNANIFGTMRARIEIPTAYLYGFRPWCDRRSSSQATDTAIDTGNGNVTAKNRNSFIQGVEGITTVRCPGDCDNDRQPEIVTWPPKPEIFISLELPCRTMTDRMEIQTANVGFLPL